MSTDPKITEEMLKQTVSSLEELKLRERIAQSERYMEQLEQELRAVEITIEELESNHHKYDVLAQICHSLEELEELGASHLFWDGEHDHEQPSVRLERARSKIDMFAREIERVERHREEILDKIDEHNLFMDCLHYDLRDATEREESRKAEWAVERDDLGLGHRAQIMPWTRGTEEDIRARRSVLAALLIAILIGWGVTLVDIPIPEREQLIELPDRVAKLVEQERLPPPPEPVAEAEPEPEEEITEPEPEEVEPEPELVPEATEEPVVAESAPVDTKEQVKSKGILAFRDSFASRADMNPSAQLGSQASFNNAGEDAVGRPERSMVTTTAPGSSGGINLSDIRRNVGGSGGDGIEGVQLSRVQSSIGGGEGPDRPLSAGVAAGRTDEEIQIVFDRYKAALYRLYNRELRRDPTLRGQIVLQLTIEPDGSVSFCEVQSSDMNAPALGDQVVNRVKTFDFGAKDVGAVTIIYPIDFLPAG